MQSPASAMTLPLKLNLCKDIEMCTEATNVWVPVPFPRLCAGEGQKNSQTWEVMLIREYRSQPRMNGVLSSHTPTDPDGCSCIHVDAICISVRETVGWFTLCPRRLPAVH